MQCISLWTVFIIHCSGSGSLFLSGTKDKIWRINEAGNWNVVSEMFLLIIQNFTSVEKI